MDNERNQETLNLDDYTHDTSSDSDVDDIYSIRQVEKYNGGMAEANDEDEVCYRIPQYLWDGLLNQNIGQ